MNVSVIIPYFNSEKFISDCLASIELKNIEIIIVNDGSYAKSFATIKKIKMPNLKVYSIKHSGLSAARNAGIQRAKGDFILPLDADDRIARDYFDKTLPLFNNPDVGFVYTHMQLFGKEHRVWKSQPFSVKRLLRFNYISACSIFRKEVWEDVGGYDEQLKNGCEDWDFWLSAVEKGWTGVFVPEQLYHYRMHETNMSKKTERDMEKISAYLRRKHSRLYDQYPLSTIKPINSIAEKSLRLYYRNKNKTPRFIRQLGKRFIR